MPLSLEYSWPGGVSLPSCLQGIAQNYRRKRFAFGIFMPYCSRQTKCREMVLKLEPSGPGRVCGQTPWWVFPVNKARMVSFIARDKFSSYS